MKYLLTLLSLLYASSIYSQSTVTVNADQTVSVNGSKFFPISVYVQSDYTGIKNMGVNTASRPFCVNLTAFNQIAGNQLYCHYTAGPGCDEDNANAIKSRTSTGFTQSINQVKSSNYLFGYGLPDEPKSAPNIALSAADTKWAYDVIKAADPNHPVFLTDYASDISAYKNSADIFLNDLYPFNNIANPLYDIKTRMVNMKNQVAPKPAWLIIQTGSQFGVPTNAQIRAETYLSIALGSTGLIFYSYDVEDANGVHNIKTDGDATFMKNLITELKNFSPYFLGNKNTSLAYSSTDIDAILKDYNGKSYLIAVNKSSTSKSITFILNGFGNRTATIVGLSSAGSAKTGQTRTVSSGSLTETFQGLEAIVYEIDAGQSATNLAINKATTTSSIEGAGLEGGKAVDGSSTSRWASVEQVDPQWLYVDLGATYSINRVKISWEDAYGKDYLVQTSANASTWTTLKTVTGNTTKVNDFTGLTGTGRYVRVYGTARGTAWGYSIFELEVYGTSASGARAATGQHEVTAEEESLTLLSPNPVEDRLSISGVENVRSVKIYNMRGESMLSVDNPVNSISVQSLTTGLYIAVIERLGKIEKIKFIKK